MSDQFSGSKEKTDKVHIYKKVAELLMYAKDFKTVESIAEDLSLCKIQVSSCMQNVKKTLAMSGLILVNERGLGYSVSGDPVALKKEVAKSLLRAKSHIVMAGVISSFLKSSSDDDSVKEMVSVLTGDIIESAANIKEIAVDESSASIGIPEHIIKLSMNKMKDVDINLIINKDDRLDDYESAYE